MRGRADQIAAVSKAISRGGYALVATGLQRCLVEGGPDSVDNKKMGKLFLALAGSVWKGRSCWRR